MATIKKILKPADEEKKKSANAADALKLFLKESHHYNDTVPKNVPISTGSLILDSAVKVTSGMVIRLVGKGAELGKTAQSFVFAENFMETMPKSKTLFIKAEGRLSPQSMKRSGLKFVFSVDEWVDGTVFVVCGNIADDIFKLIKSTLENAHQSGEHICFIIDSMDGLILKSDFDGKEIGGDMMVAGVPKLTKLFFRHCALPISHYDSLCLITGQYAAQIKADKYSPTAPNQGSSSGGSSQQHQADYVFDYNSIRMDDYILEDPNNKTPDPVKNKIIGKFARITFRKSADDITGMTYEVPIRKGQIGKKQIWVEKEVADIMLSYHMLTKGGSWLTFAPEILEEAKTAGLELPEKVQGINNLYALIEENETIKDYFYAKIKKMIDVS
jgi:hypothetical protein